MTPLRWESRIGVIDAAVLISGIASLLAFYPPAIVGFALAHIVCGFLIAPSKTIWAVTGAATLVAQIGVMWLAWRFVPSPILALLGSSSPDWLTLAAAAVVIFGVCGAVFSAAGNNDRLATYIQRFGEQTT